MVSRQIFVAFLLSILVTDHLTSMFVIEVAQEMFIVRTIRGRCGIFHQLQWRVLAAGVLLLILFMSLRQHRLHHLINNSVTRPSASFIYHPLSYEANAEGDSGAGNANATRSRGIPKIIHQIWKTRDKVPMTFRPWMASWLKLNVGWQYWFWTDEDMHKFMEILYPQYLSLYDSYPSAGYRADAFR